jgi:DNA-binding LacI/PurR family transcriptional regulator
VPVEPVHTPNAPTVAEGSRVLAELFEHSSEMATGVFAQNDLMAVGAIP